jgi:SAM-dependent methyltransferase
MTLEIHGQYNDDYYKDQILPSLQSARVILAHLWRYLQPRSVVDVGCGRGAWLKACHERGSIELYGLDGEWNSQAAMIDSSIRFRGIDLDKPFALEGKVDLAMSLEVAEHLQPSSSASFVEGLTTASDTVLFSAAYVLQNGPTHINERPHSWWGKAFLEKGYVPFDLFRPSMWGDERIQFWYRQNAFLYVNKESSSYARLRACGLSELPDIAFLDCIHPDLFKLRAGHVYSFMTHVRHLLPSLRRALVRRFGAERLEPVESVHAADPAPVVQRLDFSRIDAAEAGREPTMK